MKKNWSVLLLLCLSFGIADGYAYSMLLDSIRTQEIFQAMHDELQRSYDSLILHGSPRPYFVEYSLWTGKRYSIEAEYGGIREAVVDRFTQVTVGVRVGDYQFDNTNFINVGLSFFGSSDQEEDFQNRALPEELKYAPLRRELWLATDAAYKRAVEAYTAKQAVIQGRVRRDTLPDFSPMPPAELVDTVLIPAMDTAYFKRIARDLSRLFLQYPWIYRDRVVIEYIPRIQFYLNSEGRKALKTKLYAGLEIAITTQAADGTILVETYAAYGFSPEDLPTYDSLRRAAQSLVDNLKEIREAALIETYNGPVLLEPAAAAELFVYGFLPHLVAQRPWLTDQGETQKPIYDAFQYKLGGRVLPEFLSMEAIPKRSRYRGVPCIGSYQIDDEGIPVEEFLLVERGYLRNFFASRVPTRNTRRSNGHYRGGAPMYSTVRLKVDSSQYQKSYEELRQRLIAIVKKRNLPYGILIRKLLNQNHLATLVMGITHGEFPLSFQQGTVPIVEAVRIYPDGKEEVVRNAEIVHLNPYVFKDILVAGKNEYVYNFLAPSVVSSFLTGGSEYHTATMITPALLLEELEIKQVEEDFPKPPMLTPPFGVR